MIAERDERIKLLEQKIDLLIRRLFGAKSEKIDSAQLLLLLQGDDEPGKSDEPMPAAETPWCSKKELTLPNKPDRPEKPIRNFVYGSQPEIRGNDPKKERKEA